MADLVVDLQGLNALASQLKTVKDGLENTPDLVDSSRPSIGSGDVADAMDHFQGNWKDGRKKIASGVDSMTSMLTQSVEAYDKTDTDLGTQITGATSSTTTTVGGGGGGRTARAQ